MCGITGWIDFQRDLKHDTEIIKKMTNSLARRGPDDTNIWTDLFVGFGHKRLVVVDPEGGKQPMIRSWNSKQYTICYNGELYNTEELRKELLFKGYSFQGHSDTEVLLTAYMEWKETCVEFLNGIFAFAIWDKEEEKLFIARDRLGVKPLYYKESKSGLLFASELKALLQHPNVKAEIDLEGLSELLSLGPSHTPGSGVFKNLLELRPAHALTFTKNGLKVWRYWNVKSVEHTDSIDETVEKVRSLLVDSVKRQLVSDVPLCTFLSGGVDSSAITAIAAKEFFDTGKGFLHTYSVDYEGNDHFFKANEFQPNNDQPWIEKVSSLFHTVHHRCVISQEELIQYLTEAVHVRDLPGMADVDSSLLWFCKEIKRDFVVSLSGECADEIFGGYPWFYRQDDIKRKGFPWIRSIKVREDLLQPEWKNKLKLEDYMLSKYEQTITEMPVLEGESLIDRKRRELFYLNMIWFMTSLLERKDRMSMGASLEVRVPFADHRLVEYAWNIPWHMKNIGNQEKGLLRQALQGILPNDILYRKKSPYPKTHHPVYTESMKKWLYDILQDRNSILLELFSKEKLEDLIRTNGELFKVPWYGQLMTGPQLLAYLGQMHVWFRDYHINLV